MSGKPCPLRRVRCDTVSAAPLALSAIWSIFGWLLKSGLGDGGLATRERLHYGRY
jgi:hypothetical protein